MKNLIFIFYLLIQCDVFAQQDFAYTVKYRMVFLKDSNNTKVESNDIMLLRMNKNESLYYSYLRHFGQKNQNEHFQKIKPDESGMIDFGTSLEPIIGSFFIENESEILNVHYDSTHYTVYDKFPPSLSFTYKDTLIAPVWKLGKKTDTLLGQFCQNATTTFKGRNFTAWFAPGIPYQMGPWLLNGLPGLILKVSDDKNHYQFNCLELNTDSSYTNIFFPYKKLKPVTKARLTELKRLYITDYDAFTRQISGKTLTVTSANGSPANFKKRPYNPIDLTNE